MFFAVILFERSTEYLNGLRHRELVLELDYDHALVPVLLFLNVETGR